MVEAWAGEPSVNSQFSSYLLHQQEEWAAYTYTHTHTHIYIYIYIYIYTVHIFPKKLIPNTQVGSQMNAVGCNLQLTNNKYTIVDPQMHEAVR